MKIKVSEYAKMKVDVFIVFVYFGFLMVIGFTVKWTLFSVYVFLDNILKIWL